MKKEQILNYLEYDDLTTDLKTIADCYGLDYVKQLYLVFDGFTIHIPKIKLMNNLLKRYILNECKGKSFKRICKEVDRPYEFVHNILQSKT